MHARAPYPLSLVALLALAACGDGGTSPTPAPRPIARFTVLPHDLIVPVGESADLSIGAWDAAGTAVAAQPITFAVQDPSMATIDANGRVTALRYGRTVVTAGVPGHGRAISLTVISPEQVVAVAFGPANTLGLEVGQSLRMVAVGIDAAGMPVEGFPVSWGTSDPARLRVTRDGVVTALAPGNAEVIATLAGRTGRAQVAITPRPVTGGE